MKTLAHLSLYIALVAGFTIEDAWSAESTPRVFISALQSGWVVDRMLVFTQGTTVNTIVNPGFCPLVTNGYIISETDPGRKTFYAQLIAAQSLGRSVQLVIDGCFEQRPRIVSVSTF